MGLKKQLAIWLGQLARAADTQTLASKKQPSSFSSSTLTHPNPAATTTTRGLEQKSSSVQPLTNGKKSKPNPANSQPVVDSHNTPTRYPAPPSLLHQHLLATPGQAQSQAQAAMFAQMQSIAQATAQQTSFFYPSSTHQPGTQPMRPVTTTTMPQMLYGTNGGYPPNPYLAPSVASSMMPPVSSSSFHLPTSLNVNPTGGGPASAADVGFYSVPILTTQPTTYPDYSATTTLGRAGVPSSSSFSSVPISRPSHMSTSQPIQMPMDMFLPTPPIVSTSSSSSNARPSHANLPVPTTITNTTYANNAPSAGPLSNLNLESIDFSNPSNFFQ